MRTLKWNAPRRYIKTILATVVLVLAWTAYGPWPFLGISTDLAANASNARPAFPLAVHSSKRYLVDADSNPFLMHGDTSWSLIAGLTREETDIYLTDRRKRGFNTILVQLIERKYARNAPANGYGESPFLRSGDFSKPNEAYFAHADWVLRRAREKGFLVLLTPAYIGYGGGDEGWWHEITKNNLEALRGYGRFLGNRYRDFGNIIWVSGGDYDPPDKKPVRAIVEGIKQADPKALHTAHNAPETSVPDFWKGESWLDLNPVYTYEDVCPHVLKAYRHPNRRPVFLLESAYEFEHGAAEQRIRRQAYHALLCGASGQIFGNNPIWHFGHKGIFPALFDLRKALGSRGAQSMTHLVNLFAAVPWWELEPDFKRTFLTEGGRGHDRAVAARTGNGSFALIYIPGRRSITADLGQLAGPFVSARWFDPSSGRRIKLAGSPFAKSGPRRFRIPAKNAAGGSDWVLILQSQSESQ